MRVLLIVLTIVLFLPGSSYAAERVAGWASGLNIVDGAGVSLNYRRFLSRSTLVFASLGASKEIDSRRPTNNTTANYTEWLYSLGSGIRYYGSSTLSHFYSQVSLMGSVYKFKNDDDPVQTDSVSFSGKYPSVSSSVGFGGEYKISDSLYFEAVIGLIAERYSLTARWSPSVSGGPSGAIDDKGWRLQDWSGISLIYYFTE